MKDEKMT